jgi:hypothetical protein
VNPVTRKLLPIARALGFRCEGDRLPDMTVTDFVRLRDDIKDATGTASPADQCPPTLRTGSAPVCSLCRREVKEQAEGYTGPMCTGCAETLARFGCE